ncbi:3-deoxy-8-phosphooctulonate synthase [bacterium]|nr:3-deoxy-8-phosphooctulonate synthase [bacterium]QQR56493.1 MAG: 3-deoxy-8-phosphooctulonate synthase [Candidatus Melainabacteria bacterium]
MDVKEVKVGTLQVGKGKPFFIIAGPCVIESWETTINTARELVKLSKKLGFSLVFKSSYDKANRTSINGFRGPGLEKGLAMLADVKKELGVELLSDVHEIDHCKKAGEVLDILQIPAFLCRQTDLLIEAAHTNKCVNIKKGQFLAPTDMVNAVKKVSDAGNNNILLTERGTTFGYNNLVVDMRSLPIMKRTGYPVIFDATHSVQLPGAGSGGSSTAGQREFVPHLARAACAVGIDGMFMEVHPNPDEAKSDGPNQVALSQVEDLIVQCLKVHDAVKSMPELELGSHHLQCQSVALSK